MKTYEEVARNVLLRLDAEKLRRRKQKKAVVLSCLGAVSVFAASCIGFSFSKTEILTTVNEQTVGEAVETLPSSAEPAATDPSATSAKTSQTIAATADGSATDSAAPTNKTANPSTTAGSERQPPVTAASSTVPAVATSSLPATGTAPATSTVSATSTAPATTFYSGYSGEGSGTGELPESFTVPEAASIRFEGERITDEEAQAYLSENLPWITSALGQSGVNIEALHASSKGYCHLALNETPVVKLNFMDYLLYSGTKLVAILTLYKIDGKITSTPAFGAPWFDSFASFLELHRGERLLFLYVGNMEIVVTPGNECFNLLGDDLSDTLRQSVDYRKLYCEEIVYVP